MRIGVDASCWANGRGYGRFTREIMTAMVAQAPEDTFVFFADELAHSQFDLCATNTEVVCVAVRESPTRAASADGRRSLADLWCMTRAVAKHKPDVFFSPSVYSYFPLPVGQRAVVAIHDAIAERYPRLTLPTRRARLFWKLKVGLAVRQAALILTVSDFSKRDISERLQVPIARIRVAGEAPAAAYHPSETAEIEKAAAHLHLPPGARWFMYVGGFNPHKRVTAIVEAHAELVREDGDSAPYLLLVGDPNADAFLKDVGRIRQMIEDLGTGERIRWTGFVPDEELRHLHSGALALVLPSEVEGFGLPAVEAAACGTPVVATTESPLPEILKGGGIFVPPGDDRTLLGALRLFTKDETLRLEMGRRAMQRAGELSWDIGASAALSAIHEVAA